MLTTADLDGQIPAEAADSTGTGWLPFRSCRPIDWAVLVAVVLLTTAYFPFVLIPSYSPRLAYVGLLAPVGAVFIGRLAKGRDHSAIAALALASIAVASALVSATPLPSLLGVLGREQSALIIVFVVLAWAAARGLSTAGVAALGTVLTWVVILNMVLGILQVLFQIDRAPLELYDGRATGLLSGHVYFGAIMIGGIGLVIARRRPRRLSPSDLFLVAGFGAAANLSGSRASVALGVVVIVALLWSHRWRAISSGLSAYVVGVVAAVALSDAVGSAATAQDRAIEAGSAGRLQAWRYGLSAIGDRPLLGWGPGRFRAAVQGRFDADFTRDHASSELSQIWYDGHNVFVNTWVTLGSLGLLALIAFIWTCARHARGPLALFASLVAMSWLLQPAGLVTVPLVMLCLGASMSKSQAVGTAVARPAGPVGERSARLALLVGILVAVAVLFPDVMLKSASERRSLSAVEAAESLLPWDPVAAEAVASGHLSWAPPPDGLESAARWYREATHREPDRPYYWNRLAELQLALGDDDGAASSVSRALELQPWNVRAVQYSLVVARRTGDEGVAAEAEQRLCEVVPESC